MVQDGIFSPLWNFDNNNLLNQTIKIYDNRNFPIIPIVLVLND